MRDKLFNRVLLTMFICSLAYGVNAQTIDEVAAQFVIPVYENENLRAFNFRMPASTSLDDHQTSSRLIVLFSDLNIKRLDDNKVTKLDKHQVFFLQNSFSKGFLNLSESALDYLVAQPKYELIKGTTPNCARGALSLLRNEYTTICRYDSDINDAKITPDVVNIKLSIVPSEAGKKLHVVDIFLQETKWITWFYITD